MKTKLPKPQKLPSGSWRIQVMHNGERISVIDDDPSMAQAKAIAIVNGIIEKEEKPESVTLDQAIEYYIEAKRDILSPSTIRGYEIAKRNRFKGIMQRNIFTLKKQDVQIAVTQERRDVSAKTVYNAYGLIRPVLKEYGIDVTGVKLPQNVKKKKSFMQPEEISALMEEAKKDKYEIPILMALWLGMRRSEILGLCWDCVDQEKSTITIRRTCLQAKGNQLVMREATKSNSSQRTIQCPDYIMNKLRELRKTATEERVFPISPDIIRRHISMVCEKAGVTMTNTHGLRHTNAAIMRHLGISDAHAMERGGWSEEATYKKTYSYVFDSTATKEDARINDYMESQRLKLHTKLHTEK